jgi:dTDP-4-dehydrorhamnose reductase
MAEKIIVTGSNGQLGTELRELSNSFPEYHFIFLTREDLSISDAAAFRKLMEEHRPAYLVNCAAYTAVDRAESEKELADLVNGTAVGELAALCLEHGTKFLHISTDYVFKGDQSDALKETDAVDPVNAYGASKLLGEQLALKQNSNAIIIRTSWVYSSYGKNFVKTMMRLMNEKAAISVVSDQIGSPTYAADLAELIMHIINSGKWQSGIYHFSNEGKISWFEFATEIKRLIHSSCEVTPIKTEQYPTPAKRPHNSVMDKEKIQRTFSVSLKNWKESLQRCIDKINSSAVS